MTESRRSERELTLRTGKISGVETSDKIDCAVLNMSQSGACILVPDGTRVGEFFELVIDCEDAVRACRRVWQDGARIGVVFMGGQEHASHLAE